MHEKRTYRLQDSLPQVDDEIAYGSLSERRSSILLVEEEEDLNHALAARLRRAGYLVQSTFDSLSSLQRTGFHRTDLVLVDLVQPGPKAFAHLLEFLPLKRLARAPIVALSISDDADLLAEAERLGVSRVVLKPLDHDELLGAIRAALAESEAAS